MIGRLARRLESQPDDLNGWLLLGHVTKPSQWQQRRVAGSAAAGWPITAVHLGWLAARMTAKELVRTFSAHLSSYCWRLT